MSNFPFSPSRYCREPANATDLASAILCHWPDGVLEASPTNGLDPTLAGFGPEHTATGYPKVTPGYGYAAFVHAYLLDWGDCVARVDRRRAFATILRCFAPKPDRSYVLATLPRFLRKGDRCVPDLTAFLIRNGPHVGYRWHPGALEEWLRIVEPDPGCSKKYNGDSPSAAFGLSKAWLQTAWSAWVDLTIEPFPYAADLMLGHFQAPDAPTPLPDGAPASA